MKEKKELIEPEKLEKDLKRSKGDSVHTIARTLMELVPIAGGSAAELFSEIITPPINKRRDKWLTLIAEGIRELQNEFNEYNMDN